MILSHCFSSASTAPVSAQQVTYGVGRLRVEHFLDSGEGCNVSVAVAAVNGADVAASLYNKRIRPHMMLAAAGGEGGG